MQTVALLESTVSPQLLDSSVFPAVGEALSPAWPLLKSKCGLNSTLGWLNTHAHFPVPCLTPGNRSIVHAGPFLRNTEP